jgi:hypothetical protein
VGLERGPLSLVNNLSSYLNEKVAAPGLESTKIRSEGFVALTTQHPLSAKVSSEWILIVAFCEHDHELSGS